MFNFNLFLFFIQYSVDSAMQRAAAANPDAITDPEEAERIEKEQKDETDDPETLGKSRAMDDFKDGI